MPGNYTITARAAGATLTAVIYNMDHQNHVDHNTAVGLDDASEDMTAFRAVRNPGTADAERFPQSFRDDLLDVRYILKEIGDGDYWFTPVNIAGLIIRKGSVTFTSGLGEIMAGVDDPTDTIRKGSAIFGSMPGEITAIGRVITTIRKGSVRWRSRPGRIMADGQIVRTLRKGSVEFQSGLGEIMTAGRRIVTVRKGSAIFTSGLGGIMVRGGTEANIISGSATFGSMPGEITAVGRVITTIRKGSAAFQSEPGAIMTAGRAVNVIRKGSVTFTSGLGGITADGETVTVIIKGSVTFASGPGGIMVSGGAEATIVKGSASFASGLGSITADGETVTVIRKGSATFGSGLGSIVVNGEAVAVIRKGSVIFTGGLGAITAVGRIIPPFSLNSFVVPSGHVVVFAALLTAGVNGNERYNAAGSVGSLDDGDLDLRDDLTVSRIRATSNRVILNGSGAGGWNAYLEDAGAPFSDGRFHIQTPDGIDTKDVSTIDGADIGSGFCWLRDEAVRTRVAGLGSGDAFILALTQPTPPDADAPTVTIGAVGSVDEGATLALAASVSGGTYDGLTYDWEVVSGGGSLAGTGPGVTYTQADVTADTPVEVRCTVTATGDGGHALDSTSDTASDTEAFTVNSVPDAVAPTVTIAAVEDFGFDETAELTAAVVGGTYDELTYEWEIVSGGGTLSATTGSSVTYTPPEEPD